MVRNAKKDDLPLLMSLAKEFDLPVLEAPVSKLQKPFACSAKQLRQRVCAADVSAFDGAEETPATDMDRR